MTETKYAETIIAEALKSKTGKQSQKSITDDSIDLNAVQNKGKKNKKKKWDRYDI